METLKVAFIDFWPEWDYENFISPIIQKYYNIEIDNNKPDIVFHSIFQGMRNTSRYKCKKILFLGENYRPTQFKSDYSISFDLHTTTNFRLPLWQAFLLLWPNLKELLYNRVQHQEFKRFCSFTVSNPSNQIRNNAFDELSKYQKVHSYGRVRTNSLELSKLKDNEKPWQQTYIEFFNNIPHKFSLTFENTSYPYYCTEKIMHSFLVGSIPLYWGDPKIREDWNEQSFINISSNYGWIDEVKRLDQNNEYFKEKYNQPMFKDYQKQRLDENLEYFETWLIDTIKK